MVYMNHTKRVSRETNLQKTRKASDYFAHCIHVSCFVKGDDGMGFKVMARCRRTPAEQQYIWAAMRVWNKLPPQRREEVRALIGRIARTPEEGRTLYDMVVRDATPQSVYLRIGVPLRRVYELRREFYEKFVI